MSYYYKYDFVSPEGIYAIVADELKSYLDTGAVDQLLWPTYLNKCLDKLGKSSYYITETILTIEDFQARLPDNFFSVREAWLCVDIEALPYQTANSFYSQAASQTTIQVSPITTNRSCCNTDCGNAYCDGTQCMPALIQAVYKTNNEVLRNFKKMYLLKPGNISVKQNCSLDCANFGSSAADTFDIRDNKFTTNFRKGTVYLVFYATEYDKVGNQMIPNNYRVKEYIEAFLKYKVFETMLNQTNDETYNQIKEKLTYYKSLSDEAYILAESEIKKQTADQKIRAIKAQKNSFERFELPMRNRFYWRRNA